MAVSNADGIRGWLIQAQAYNLKPRSDYMKSQNVIFSDINLMMIKWSFISETYYLYLEL